MNIRVKSDADISGQSYRKTPGEDTNFSMVAPQGPARASGRLSHPKGAWRNLVSAQGSKKWYFPRHTQDCDFRILGLITLLLRSPVSMRGEKRERWMELCAQIASEQDPDKVLELAKQLNQMLEEKERRLGILPKLDSEL